MYLYVILYMTSYVECLCCSATIPWLQPHCVHERRSHANSRSFLTVNRRNRRFRRRALCWFRRIWIGIIQKTKMLQNQTVKQLNKHSLCHEFWSVVQCSLRCNKKSTGEIALSILTYNTMYVLLTCIICPPIHCINDKTQIITMDVL